MKSLTNLAIKIILPSHRMIVFVLFYRLCLKEIISSFGLMSTMDKSISINISITDFAKYPKDLS